MAEGHGYPLVEITAQTTLALILSFFSSPLKRKLSFSFNLDKLEMLTDTACNVNRHLYDTCLILRGTFC